MDVQNDFGENERDQDNQHRVELALLSFDCQVANRPHSPYDQSVVVDAKYAPYAKHTASRTS
jgi:hypothetical protein